jgi:multiple sugar transport system permease protein
VIASRRRWVNVSLTALTYVVLLIMLAPVLWLVASSMQTRGELASGDFDLLHPTLGAFGRMWKGIDFERYLVNSIVVCTGAAALATAFAARPATRSRASASAAPASTA